MLVLNTLQLVGKKIKLADSSHYYSLFESQHFLYDCKLEEPSERVPGVVVQLPD